jgi:hypothetical protein
VNVIRFNDKKKAVQPTSSSVRPHAEIDSEVGGLIREWILCWIGFEVRDH